MKYKEYDQVSSDIKTFFINNGKKVYTYNDFRTIFEEKNKWNLKRSFKLSDFIANTVELIKIKVIEITNPYTTFTRYLIDNPSVYEIIQSLNTKGYFSHLSAVSLHNLTKQIPKSVYFNIEQSKKVNFDSELTQEKIDLAFKAKQRITNNIAKYDNFTIYFLSGKKTSDLGIIQLNSPDGKELRVTNIERTLIDIVVRPEYSGGVTELLNSYQSVKKTVSINKLCSIYSKLEYIYPYHQAIGFLLEKTGYTEKQLELLKQFDIKYNFYLTHGLKNYDYSRRWKLFIPKGM